MSALLYTHHNGRVPVSSPRNLQWLGVGEGLLVNETGTLLFAFRDKQSGQPASLLLALRYPGGHTQSVKVPEDLSFHTTDALVRAVESDETGPLRVLLEIGDHVAFPQMRGAA